MAATLRHISFLRIDVLSPVSAEVATLEDWEYTHVNIDSKEVMSRNAILYELKYSLEKRGEQWLVIDISVLKEEVQPEGEVKAKVDGKDKQPVVTP